MQLNIKIPTYNYQKAVVRKSKTRIYKFKLKITKYQLFLSDTLHLI